MRVNSKDSPIVLGATLSDAVTDQSVQVRWLVMIRGIRIRALKLLAVAVATGVMVSWVMTSPTSAALPAVSCAEYALTYPGHDGAGDRFNFCVANTNGWVSAGVVNLNTFP